MRLFFGTLALLMVLTGTLCAQNSTAVPADSIRYHVITVPGDTTVDPSMPKIGNDVSIPVERQPVPIQMTPPDTSGGRRGVAWCRCYVGADGRVSKASVARSTSPALDAPALSAVRMWRFSPAIIKGKPAGLWVMVPIRFGQRE